MVRFSNSWTSVRVRSPGARRPDCVRNFVPPKNLPAGSFVAAPASSYALIRQVLSVLEGAATIVEGEQRTALQSGDRLEFGPPADVVFQNETGALCRYPVAVVRQRS